MGNGDCFIVAANLVRRERDLILVHGIPLGLDGEAKGKRYWHAWVEQTTTYEHPELPHPITTTAIIDRSNGQDIVMPAGAYYNIGRVEQTWRYTADEAEALMDETGHFGPWVDVEGAA